MALTQKQQSIVSHYLRDVAGHMDASQPARKRQRGLYRLETRMQREIQALAKDTPEDADVVAVIERFGPPAEQAVALWKIRADDEPVWRRKGTGVWLGVCAWLADELGVDPWVIRLLAILLGITGPVVLLTYLGFYLFLHYSGRRKDTRSVNWLLVAQRLGATFLIALALHAGAGYARTAIYWAHERFLLRPVGALGEWGWLETDAPSFFFWALFLGLPLAAMSAMPLANAWDYTLKRVVQAGLALYGIALSFGIASILVGIILGVLQDFSAGDLTLQLPFDF